MDFIASVIPPGAAVLLPPAASELALGPPQTSPEVDLSIEEGTDQIRGVIPLAGLGAALSDLTGHCPTR